MLLTFGGLGAWWLFDMAVIIMGKFTDREGHQIVAWV
jgi:hypothetical protein